MALSDEEVASVIRELAAWKPSELYLSQQVAPYAKLLKEQPSLALVQSAVRTYRQTAAFLDLNHFAAVLAKARADELATFREQAALLERQRRQREREEYGRELSDADAFFSGLSEDERARLWQACCARWPYLAGRDPDRPGNRVLIYAQAKEGQ